jgi:hemerythrin-like domain-containing protein
MGMDALTLVRQDHRELEGLLERCERLDEHAEDGRAVLLGQLTAAVRQHVDQEEAILYAIFRERARRAEMDLAPLDRALEQHRMIDRLGRELTDAGTDDVTRNAKLTVLTEQVRNHLDDENSYLLTAIEDLIDDDTLLELGRRMEQRDRVTEARRELVSTVIPGGARGRRVAAALGGLVAVGTALLAVLARRRRPSPPPPTGWRRIRRR